MGVLGGGKLQYNSSKEQRRGLKRKVPHEKKGAERDGFLTR